MFKTFLTTVLFFVLCINVFSDTESDAVEFVGIVKKQVANTYENPDEKSKVLRRFYRGTKLIVFEVDEKEWLKVKINNAKTGYIKREDVDFKNTLKKEAVKNSYKYNKVSLELKSVIERFNINFSESMYFQQEGIVPQFEYMDLFFKDGYLKAEFVYTTKTKFENEKTAGKENPFADEIKDFIELLFFKMMIYEAELYRINLYKYNYNGKLVEKVLYATFEYKYDDEQFKLIKNKKGMIWNFVKASIPLEEVFKYYP
ncbi:SH3 domain-containing protein [Deferribacteraceae bacterium V6Fe1]|nr:SH3 domain-containing protein [Deferribacteraceae bacterium V6Fe1]